MAIIGKDSWILIAQDKKNEKVIKQTFEKYGYDVLFVRGKNVYGDQNHTLVGAGIHELHDEILFDDFGRVNYTKVGISEADCGILTRAWFEAMKECCADKKIDGKTYVEAFTQYHKEQIDVPYNKKMDELNRRIEETEDCRKAALARLSGVVGKDLTQENNNVSEMGE